MPKENRVRKGGLIDLESFFTKSDTSKKSTGFLRRNKNSKFRKRKKFKSKLPF